MFFIASLLNDPLKVLDDLKKTYDKCHGVINELLGKRQFR